MKKEPIKCRSHSFEFYCSITCDQVRAGELRWESLRLSIQGRVSKRKFFHTKAIKCATSNFKNTLKSTEFTREQTLHSPSEQKGMLPKQIDPMTHVLSEMDAITSYNLLQNSTQKFLQPGDIIQLQTPPPGRAPIAICRTSPQAKRRELEISEAPDIEGKE